MKTNRQYLEVCITLPKQVFKLGGGSEVVLEREFCSQPAYLHFSQYSNKELKNRIIKLFESETLIQCADINEFDADCLMNTPKVRIVETLVPHKYRPITFRATQEKVKRIILKGEK